MRHGNGSARCRATKVKASTLAIRCRPTSSASGSHRTQAQHRATAEVYWDAAANSPRDPSGMDLTWIDPEHLDERDVAGTVAMMVAAQVVDTPSAAPWTRTGFIADLTVGWDGDPAIYGLRRDKRGRVVGVLAYGFTTWDNDHLGFVEVTVDPEARRQGLGRQLLEEGIDRVRA